MPSEVQVSAAAATCATSEWLDAFVARVREEWSALSPRILRSAVEHLHRDAALSQLPGRLAAERWLARSRRAGVG